MIKKRPQEYKVINFIGLQCRHKFVNRTFFKHSDVLDLGLFYDKHQKGKIIRVIDTETYESRLIREDRLEVVKD